MIQSLYIPHYKEYVDGGGEIPCPCYTTPDMIVDNDLMEMTCPSTEFPVMVEVWRSSGEHLRYRFSRESTRLRYFGRGEGGAIEAYAEWHEDTDTLILHKVGEWRLSTRFHRVGIYKQM